MLNETRVVGIDVAFFEESNYNSDEILAEAISKNGKVVLPVEYIDFKLKEDAVFSDKVLKFHLNDRRLYLRDKV